MKAAFHQGLGPALADQRDRLGGGVNAMFGIDDFEAADVDIVGRRDFTDSLLRPDQDRFDQLEVGGADHRLER